MFISKTHLGRRTFLRGAGATIALPLLDAMLPARTVLAATAGRPTPRMAFVYFPHGAVMNQWTPAESGRHFQFGRILEPLASFSDRLTIVSGLENRHAYGPVHAITPGLAFRGVPQSQWRCVAGYYRGPDCGPVYRPEHPTVVDRSHHGGAEENLRRCLGRSIQRLLRRDDFVPLGVGAVADGIQPTQSL